MKKFFFTTLLTVLSISFSGHVYAASSHDAHSEHGSHAMKTGHEAHAGMKIHESSRDGYTFEYRLINMKEKMEKLKNMPEIKDTHHLMVFVKDSHGSFVKTAKVGYLIQKKESGAVQKKMAMAMSNGFGADITIAAGSHYLIKTKVIAGSKKLMDEFKYVGGDH